MRDGRPRATLVVLAAALMLASPRIVTAQQPQTTPPAPTPSALSDTVQAGEAETDAPRRKLVRWNEYEGSFFTTRMGGAFQLVGVTKFFQSRLQLHF